MALRMHRTRKKVCPIHSFLFNNPSHLRLSARRIHFFWLDLHIDSRIGDRWFL